MGKLDEQLIQLINNEIERKGGGFEEFCTLASEVVQPVVKKVFPKNETLYKKAVKQILVRMYQKIEMADMNQIQEWMERFALDVLEKNYPRETAAAKKREARPEQETVKNEESLQKSARTEEQEQDELIAAAMAAFAKLQDGQPEEQVELPEEVQSFFEPEQPKEQDLQDTQELQIEITQPVERKSDENPAGQIAQESESTIRRDLIALDEMGKLNKVHGGATAVAHQFIADEIAVSVKEQLCVEEKKAIARYAVNMINDDDFIFIDAGTSTGWMIEYLESTRATFVTNGIAHIKRLMNKGLRAYMIGGLGKPVTESTVGADAVNNMKMFNFSKCFLGTNGVHTDYGFTTVDVEEALVKMEAVNRSYASVVLADHTKFDKVTAVTFAGIKKACIITDRLVNDKYADATVIKEVMKE